ncbi:MAG TPA: hypothetical protein VFI06_16720 [Chitinophagaceae bacterium]|nr:hypothetical protein [Chitinophagaceae bacterium]
MNSDNLPIILISALTSILISYLIIKFAVKDALAEMRQHARIQTDILAKMAIKAGVTPQEIQESYSR